MNSSAAFVTVLKALFKNKFRLDEKSSKKTRIGLYVIFGFVYIVFLAVGISLAVTFGSISSDPTVAMSFYLIFLLTGAGFVLIFGIVSLVSTLFLSKDTDFYSSLPVKPWVVFGAKILYVYLCEVAIVVAILLPTLIVFGAVAKLWAGFYIISILTLPIVPALPLALAAIIAVPIMFLAGKLKNRNIVALIFYIALFLGFFALYMYLIMSTSFGAGEDEELTPEQLEKIASAMQAVGYAVYPYILLCAAAMKVSLFSLESSVSVVVGLLLFVAFSALFIAILMLLGKFMYAKSATANNQTDNSKAKKGEFKAKSAVSALIKREYVAAMRTTQTAFQCFSVYLLPLLFSVIMGIMMRQGIDGVDGTEAEAVLDNAFFADLITCTILIITASMANASFTSFSREGSAIQTLKTLPVDAKTIVTAKAIAWGIPAITVAIVSAVVGGVIIFDPVVFALSIIAMPLYAATSILFGVLWDLGAPKLKWTDPLQAVKHNGRATGGMFIMMILGFAALISYMLTFFFSQSFAAAQTVKWILTFVGIIIFGVIDVIMFKKAQYNFNRIEC